MSKIRLLLAASWVLAAPGADLRAEELSSAGPVAEARSADARSADSKLDVLLDAIRANRKAFVAVNLELTDDEAAGFWPIYDRYQKDLDAIGDRLARVVQDYTANFRSLSNEAAMALVGEYLSVEADRVLLRRSYLEDFAKNLPGRTVARLYQIENKLDAVIRYDLAAAIPVIDEESSAPAK